MPGLRTPVLLGICIFAAVTLPRSESPLRAPPSQADAWIDRTLQSLTLEQKVAQLVCPDINASYVADDDSRLTRWVELARDHGVGMFVLYGGTPRDVASLLNRLQGVARVPILMAADFEGGPGQQVSGASEYPANMAFAAIGSDDLMYRAGAAAAVEGRAMGIHLTYTPVVDVSVSPDNPAESVRSFGGDMDLLGRMVRAYVRGYHDNGMLTSAKHFPGRGDVTAMPGNPPWMWNDKPVAALRAQEFAAFRHGIAAGVDFVMSEHVAVPRATGGSSLPASVEPKLARGWLRDSLGFRGILTTDDLWYDHVVARFGAEEVALKAFEAGHDIILKPKDPVATIRAMAAAVRSGRISQARVDDAVRRLLVLKARLNLHNERLVDVAKVGERVGIPAHQALVQDVADRSLTLLRNDGVLPIAPARLARMVNINVQKTDGDPSPPLLNARLLTAFPTVQNFTLRPDMDAGYYETAWRAIEGAELVVLSFFTQRNRLGEAAPIRAPDLSFLRRVIAAKPQRVLAMSYGNPHVIRQIPSVPAFVTGYGERGWFGNQPAYFESFVRLVRGDIKPQGKLPVSAGPGFAIGTGLTY